MTNEESKIMWKLEEDSFAELQKVTGKVSELMTNLFNIVGNLIENDKLQYDKYVEDVRTTLLNLPDDADPTETVTLTCDKLIEKYSKL